jgi:chemotaxis protein methyltransferase CheR
MSLVTGTAYRCLSRRGEMAFRLSDARLIELSALIADRMGLYFSKERSRDLERGIYSIARELNFEDAESCICWLLSQPSKECIEILASHLTIGETYFFRERASFEALEKRVLPELIESRKKTGKRLRIWSAGCCTGEEPYSIAMLLSRMIPDIPDWKITILATDINPRFLKKAADGVFTKWSFRDPKLKIKERYFKQIENNRFEILPKIKNMVTFSHLNLATDNYPSMVSNTGSMDIIFCRNVLMYFALEQVKRVVQRLHRSLVDGGWLLVAPADASHLTFSGFETVNFPGVIIHRKVSHSGRSGAIDGKDAEQPDKLPLSYPKASASWAPGILNDCDVHNAYKEMDYSPALATEFDANPKIQPLPSRPAENTESEKDEPDPDSALYLEASTLYERGSYAEAKKKSQELLSLNHHDTRATALLARIYADEGRLVEALNWCEEAIMADKLNPRHRYLHATILQEQGQDESAIFSLRQALYLDQNFVMAHVALGNLLRLHGRYREAERRLAGALSLLNAYRSEDIVPEAEGVTVQRLIEIIRSATSKEKTE